ncbi:MAG: tetratricopeptide repeat protein [Nitrospirota bacterium]
MKKHIVATLAVVILILSASSYIFAGGGVCAKKDAVCREFDSLNAAGKYQSIIDKVNPKRSYSDEARALIGNAYLMAAGREGNTPQQEEQLCLKALNYGATSAYMSLYFLYVKTDEAKAAGFLKQFVKTKPRDAAPYMLLGEADYKRGNFAGAKDYLHEAKAVSRGTSGDLDWLLFKVSYLAGDRKLASAMLESAFSSGKTSGDLKALVSSDARFAEMGKQYEFRKFFKILNGVSIAKASGKE